RNIASPAGTRRHAVSRQEDDAPRRRRAARRSDDQRRQGGDQGTEGRHARHYRRHAHRRHGVRHRSETQSSERRDERPRTVPGYWGALQARKVNVPFGEMAIYRAAFAKSPALNTVILSTLTYFLNAPLT